MPDTLSAALLDYSIDIVPPPLQVSLNSGAMSYAVIRFVASNSNPGAVNLSRLQFVLPTGVLAQSLTADAAAVLFRSEPVGEWLMAMTAYGVFTAIPAAVQPVAITSNGLYFQLDNVPVNMQLGSVRITIHETASGPNTGEQVRSVSFRVAPR